MNGDGLVRIEGIAEDDLFGAGIDAQCVVLFGDFLQLIAVVATVYPQPLEKLAKSSEKFRLKISHPNVSYR